MSECPECGVGLRDGDAVTAVNGVWFHTDCIEAAHRERTHARTIRAGGRLLGLGASFLDPDAFNDG